MSSSKVVRMPDLTGLEIPEKQCHITLKMCIRDSLQPQRLHRVLQGGLLVGAHNHQVKSPLQVIDCLLYTSRCV